MAYIYENDITKTSANLQKTVAYLVSLHKNEYEWNMLGIKVVGHIDALPIPVGEYDYGDAYMVGTETPYDMYIYTRADDVHKTPYWFDIGKFPAPGAQGPAGPSLVDVESMNIDGVNSVIYDTDDGAVIDYGSTKMTYVDPNTHETKNDNIDLVEIKLPIKPGKYISMDADSSNMNLEIKVDDTELALDYAKVPKYQDNRVHVPAAYNGVPEDKQVTYLATPGTIMYRNDNGDTYINSVYTNQLRNTNGQNNVSTEAIYYTCMSADLTITKTSTDTGTLSAGQLANIKAYTNVHISYDNQIYYRMDPTTAPDGTLTFIHIDTLQNVSGGYKATGKAFNVTVSTRAWQVVDIDFGSGSSTLYNHHIRLSTTTGDKYFIDVIDTQASYTGTAFIASKHMDPINALFAGAGSTTTFTPKIIKFNDSGDLQVITAENVVSETVTASQITVSDQVQLIT